MAANKEIKIIGDITKQIPLIFTLSIALPNSSFETVFENDDLIIIMGLMAFFSIRIFTTELIKITGKFAIPSSCNADYLFMIMSTFFFKTRDSLFEYRTSETIFRGFLQDRAALIQVFLFVFVA